MGKSPGKWIKAKLFGKKSPISTISERGKAGKEAFIVSKASSGVVTSNDPVTSNPQPVVVYKNGPNLGSGNQVVARPPRENDTFLSGSQAPDDHSGASKKEKAAAKVQAALRGFLARRAFWALKGIIRLQALIRGHLVRRQAVATMHCMQGIVKFQALVRGQKVRLSEAGIDVKQKRHLEKLKLDTIGVLESNRPVKLSRNVFAQKLLASTLNAMPLSLHYDSRDVNSAWNWLERWSSSRFWELVVKPKRDNGSKASRKSGSNKGGEMENGRPKRSVLRNSANHDNSSDFGKPRSTMKKSTSHQAGPTQENAQNELEKVKRNLRKVSLTKSDTKDKPETVSDKPKRKTSKMPIRKYPVVPEQGSSNSVEKHRDSTNSIFNEKQYESADTNLAEKDSGSFDAITKEPESVIPPTPVAEKLENSRPDQPSSEALQQLVQKDENSPVVIEELHSKEDSGGKDKENQKAKRRKSLSATQDYTENDTQNTPTLPSYMQATKSAKAKLRAQGSPRPSQDTPENGIVRRHSLPSSANGKLNSPSPRIQKLVQGSGKGGIKSDKSLSASKDYNINESATEWKK